MHLEIGGNDLAGQHQEDENRSHLDPPMFAAKPVLLAR